MELTAKDIEANTALEMKIAECMNEAMKEGMMPAAAATAAMIQAATLLTFIAVDNELGADELEELWMGLAARTASQIPEAYKAMEAVRAEMHEREGA